ncbi:MAG: hypothetical protein ACK5P7_08270 [Bdellovibrio sp.]|jgi:hypothetical protein
MKMMNEALRMFLAVTALILTAMLTNPSAETPGAGPQNQPKMAKASKSSKSERKLASHDLKSAKVARR